MELTFKRVESYTEPQPVDNSSASVVYINKNIKPVSKNNTTVWQFDRVTLTKEQYELYKIEEEYKKKTLTLELAIAELAEAMLNKKGD